MQIHMEFKQFLKNIYFWALIWLFFLIYYALSLSYGFNTQKADYVAYGVQLTSDVCLGIFNYLAFRNATDKVTKCFLLSIFISIIIGLFSTEIYNFLFNIIGFNNSYSNINLLWVLPYTILIFTQIFIWSYLLYAKNNEENKFGHIKITRSKLFLYAIIMLILGIFIISIFKSSTFKTLNTFQIFNTVLEIIFFIILSICLVRSKNKGLSYLATGFLLLIAFNLVHRFSYMSGNFYKTFDIAWLISYLFAIFGLKQFSEKKGEKIEFFDQNSLHVLTGVIFTIFSSLIFAIFIFLEFFSTSLEINKLGQINLLLGNLPSILIFSFIFSVLVSKMVAYRLSWPLEQMIARIDLIQKGHIVTSSHQPEKIQITEIKKLDNFIFKTISELHTANSVKSNFLMHMSHDFRTPASGIFSMSKLVLNRLNDDKLKKLQALVVNSSSQLLELLDDVLDYSRLDSKMVKLKIEKINVNKLIEDVVIFMAAKAQEKELKIQVNLPIKNSFYFGDKVLLHRILINLVSNAIKFTDNGEVTILLYHENDNGRDKIKILVKDTGIGIDSKYFDMIFQPFFRVESSETSKYPGVGLGLSNICLMLEKLSGKITVESMPEQGSIFTITLPGSL